MTAVSYKERAALCQNQSGKALLFLMEEKETNLCVNADVTHSEELLRYVEMVGPHICLLKTHIDILEDFSPAVTKALTALAKKHRFLIFEDRKFADIGTIVKAQYAQGIYRIADWADIVNAHVIPGPGIIEGLQEAGNPRGRGLLLLAQMSSKGTLAKGDYTETCVEMAQEYPEFVMGYIAQEKIDSNPGMIHMTPGVKFTAGGDTLGQQYNTPEMVIGERESDIIIVGRGIIQANNPTTEAERYRESAWKAYQQRLIKVC